MTCKIVVVRSVWVLITLQIFPSFSFVNNDGWIPLTKEEVMRKQNDRFNRRSFDEHSTSPEYNDFMATKTLKNDAIKVVVPNINFQISKDNFFNPLEATKKIKTIYQNSNKQCNNQDCELYHQENYSDEKKDELGNIEVIRRKPKSLTGADITTKDVNNELSENIILQKLKYKNPDTEFNPNKAVTERIQNIYEVTEDISDISEDTTYSKRTGYIYKHPALNAKSPTELNITNIFLDNLSKYNIRLGDDLPNYALSRQTKGMQLTTRSSNLKKILLKKTTRIKQRSG
ncbi:hypothetical protein evm_000686 [Chilo suppressalis]|nr:hypothetical protein evm_000686 [Chilo suppressalis]